MLESESKCFGEQVNEVEKAVRFSIEFPYF